MKFAQVAIRNLSRQKRRTLLLAGAIAFGIFIVTMVNAFAAGTVWVIKENMANMIGGHVFVALQHREGDRTVEYITDDSKLMACLKQLGVQDSQISKSVDTDMGQASLVFNGKSTMQMVIGSDWSDRGDLGKKLNLSPEEFQTAIANENGVIISKKTADKLKVQKGDTVLIKSRTIHGQANVDEFTVSAITSDTSEFGSMVVFANQAKVNRLLDMPGDKSYILLRVRLDSMEMAPDFATRLEAALSKDYPIAPKDVTTVNMSNVRKIPGKSSFAGERIKVTTINDIVSAMGVDQASVLLRYASIIMLVVMLLITMVGIANTFRMIMYERTKEIGTMRALGMHRGEIQRMFLYEAVFLSLLGVVIGLIMAGIGMVLVGLIGFGTDSVVALFLNNGHLSFMYDGPSMISSTILVVIFTVLAALGPARKAAKLAPAEALRSNY